MQTTCTSSVEAASGCTSIVSSLGFTANMTNHEAIKDQGKLFLNSPKLPEIEV